MSARRPIFGIALTGFGMEEDIRKSHDGGFDHHLIKPVDLNRLDSIIQQGSLPEGESASQKKNTAAAAKQAVKRRK